MENANRSYSITVIIPVFNTASYLIECLNSLQNQTFQDFNVILVDDGSMDFGGSICDAFSFEDSRVQVIKQKNAGQSAARNAAMKIAEGKYLYFLDSDDYIDADLLKKLYYTAENEKADIVFFEAESFYDDNITQQTNRFEYDRIKYYEKRNCREQFKDLFKNGEYFVCVPLHFYRRAFLEENHIVFKEGIVFEDNLFSAQVYFSDGTAVHLHEKGYFRRVHAQSTMTTKDEATLIYKCGCLATDYFEISKLVSVMKPYNDVMWSYISQTIDSVIYAFDGLSPEGKKDCRNILKKVRYHAFWHFGIHYYPIARKCADPVMKIIVRGIHYLVRGKRQYSERH